MVSNKKFFVIRRSNKYPAINVACQDSCEVIVFLLNVNYDYYITDVVYWLVFHFRKLNIVHWKNVSIRTVRFLYVFVQLL